MLHAFLAVLGALPIRALALIVVGFLFLPMLGSLIGGSGSGGGSGFHDDDRPYDATRDPRDDAYDDEWWRDRHFNSSVDDTVDRY